MNKDNYYPLVSVIVPVYNVEGYLERCSSSILNQTYNNLEIILVDDGSTDSSGDLCDTLQACDGRIRVVHSENRGLSGARNLGLKHIHGEWIVYVDSDDYIGPNHIFNLLSAVVGAQAKVGVTGAFLSIDDGRPSKDTLKIPSMYSLLTAEEAMYIALKSPRLPFAEHAWGKIYHVSLAPFLIYPEGKYYEDQFVTYRVFYEAGNAIVYEDANDYYYTVDRTTSICKTKDAKILDSLDARKEIVAFAHAQNLPRIEELADQLYYGSLIGDTATFILENQPDLARQMLQRVIQERRKALISPYTLPTTKIAMILSFLPWKLYRQILLVSEKNGKRQERLRLEKQLRLEELEEIERSS